MVEQAFISAAKSGQLCELTDHAGNIRQVEPYMVYRSGLDKRLFHCFQISGYSESGHPIGWKNLEVSSFRVGSVADGAFRQRPQYNPHNASKFPTIYFALQKTSGSAA